MRFVFFRSPFLYPSFPFTFPYISTTKLTKKDGLYCVGEGLFRFDFRWWLLDCVIIDISIPPALGVLIFCFVIGGGSFICGFFCGISLFACFLVWDVGGFGFRESWFPTGGLFIYLGTKRWIVFFFELLFF